MTVDATTIECLECILLESVNYILKAEAYGVEEAIKFIIICDYFHMILLCLGEKCFKIDKRWYDFDVFYVLLEDVLLTDSSVVVKSSSLSRRSSIS